MMPPAQARKVHKAQAWEAGCRRVRRLAGCPSASGPPWRGSTRLLAGGEGEGEMGLSSCLRGVGGDSSAPTTLLKTRAHCKAGKHSLSMNTSSSRAPQPSVAPESNHLCPLCCSCCASTGQVAGDKQSQLRGVSSRPSVQHARSARARAADQPDPCTLAIRLALLAERSTCSARRLRP